MANTLKILAKNKKARFNYAISDSLECGVVLTGTEVKSIKSGRFSFSDAYARIKNDEAWLIGFHIAAYPFGNMHNHEPERERRLLLHKQEIKRLRRRLDEKGFSLIPLQCYLKHGLVKLELGLGKGKKLYDKRESIKRKDLKREADRELSGRF